MNAVNTRRNWLVQKSGNAPCAAISSVVPGYPSSGSNRLTDGLLRFKRYSVFLFFSFVPPLESMDRRGTRFLRNSGVAPAGVRGQFNAEPPLP